MKKKINEGIIIIIKKNKKYKIISVQKNTPVIIIRHLFGERQQ